MNFSRVMVLASSLACAFVFGLAPAPACCPAPPHGRAVVNANQTVILLWDAANKTQHFIRKASFASEADDFGFLVPTPQEPELAESGEDAFDYLAKLTKPRFETRYRFTSMGCIEATRTATVGDAVNVLQQKIVAGFKATVLEAKSAQALVGWLKENGYAFSPEVEAWAKPYVEAGWKMTALKLTKGPDPSAGKNVAAKSLRISFKTDRPLFPYREPDPTSFAKELNARHRTLRIYFIGEARYKGALGDGAAWSGNTVWSKPLAPGERENLLHLLDLPATTGPATWRLTEIEDNWLYRSAPADVYFAPDADQSETERPPTPQFVNVPSELVLLGGIALVAATIFAVRSVARRNSK
ncbi:MAG: DUF2330 domain-containing protein [Gemmataceae bacterium]